MTGLHAARVAARLRRELKLEVQMVHGRYGEFQVIVDGEPIIDGGAVAFLGVLPSANKIVKAVRERLESA